MRAFIAPILCCAGGLFSPVMVSAEKRSDRLALYQLVGEDTLAENALAICQQASRLPVEERLEFLAGWVLPNEDHPTFRLTGDFHSTNPAPLVNFRRNDSIRETSVDSAIGRYLKSRQSLAIPALDLIDAARSANRMDELRERILAIEPIDIEPRCSQAALLFIVDVARGDHASAEASFEELIRLLREVDRTPLAARWRDVLVMWATFADDRAREIIGDYFFSYYGDLATYYPDHRFDVLTDYIRVLHGISRQQNSEQTAASIVSEASGGTSKFVPFGYRAAFNHAHGRPTALWSLGDADAWKFAGHELDYLSYRLPLRGNYVIECDTSSGSAMHNTFMVAGKRVEYIGHDNTISLGTFRFGGERFDIDPPTVTIQDWVRHRAVVQDGKLTHFINGLKVFEQTLSPHHPPWVAVANWRRSQGGFQNLRILGEPAIPDELQLTADPELAGWVPYFETGFGANQGYWSIVEESTGGYGISGYHRPDLAGTGMEKLISYIRPMVEGGTMEYDFFYQADRIGVHPALDRLAFLLEPEGVRIHWITDGKNDRSGLDPWNVTIEPENQRGPTRLPFIDNDWNRVRLTLEQDSVRISLNGQLVYERTLESDNHRTFGLFHYCGETEAHARNVVWRGNWPKSLPPPEVRQFSKSTTAELDDEREALPARFHHDFRAGLPPELFAVEGDETHLKRLDRGVYVERAADDGVHAIRTCFQIAGDFDIVLAYEDLEINLPVFLERTGIGLATWLHNLQEDKCEVYRRNGRSSGDQRAEFEHFIVQPNGKFHYNGGQHIGEAATWGKLRLARRGDTIYALVAEFDSPDYRLITQRTVSSDDVIPQGVKLFTQSSRYLSVSAVFTDLEIRAERLFGLPVDHSADVVTKLNKQRENLQAQKLDFRQPESYAEQFVPVGPSADPAQTTAEGLRVKADSAGPTKWIQYTTQNLPASVVDAEVDLTVHQLDAADDLGLHSEVVFETIFASVPGQPLAPLEAALILRQKANGVRTLVARVYRSRRGGGYTYLPIRSIPIQSPDRLRIAIDNKTIYFLYSETGSDEMKVLGEYFPETELTIDNVLLNVRANGTDCVADVSWKSLSMHHRDETPEDSRQHERE